MHKILILLLVFLTGCNNQGNTQIEEFVPAAIPQKIKKKTEVKKEFGFPLKSIEGRITKKPFGIKISPSSSPVQPERFSGYHTGTDFEIFENELDKKIEVFSICSGTILSKSRVEGYGGVITQSCKYINESVVVLYGHLSLNSPNLNVGDQIVIGDKIADLGENKSTDTDGERKHLHLGISKGNDTNFKGYITSEKELNNWIDFETLIE